MENTVSVGDMLIYNGEESIISEKEISIGEKFTLINIEDASANLFYWIENDGRNLILINDEINAFDVVKQSE